MYFIFWKYIEIIIHKREKAGAYMKTLTQTWKTLI